MDKAHVAHIYRGTLLCQRKNETTSSAATWMSSEMITPSDVSQTETDKCHVVSLTSGIVKNNTNELMYKPEPDPQT